MLLYTFNRHDRGGKKYIRTKLIYHKKMMSPNFTQASGTQLESSRPAVINIDIINVIARSGQD